MLFDTHAHVNFKAFHENWKAVLDNCQKNSIWLTNVGSQYETSKKAVELAEKYEKGVYATIGIHPVHAHTVDFDAKKFTTLIRSNKGKVVGVGETGIDFWHNTDHFDIQKEVFIKHIELAVEYDQALVIHGRNDKEGKISCYDEITKILRRFQKLPRAVVHCFGGNSEEAKKFLDLGLFIGFTGIITFKNAQYLQNIAQNIVPIDQLLIETDSPYLSPHPFRGKENKPQNVEFVCKKIAELKEKDYNEVELLTFQNALKLYNIKN